MRKINWIPWAILAGALALAMNGGFGRPVWKQHSSNSVEVYHSGLRYAVLPTCPADLRVMEFGTLCKDPADGKIKYRGTMEEITP